MKSKQALHRTKWGFYQYIPPPSKQVLEEHYSKKYYQQGMGSYSTHYTEEEITWWHVRAELIAMALDQVQNTKSANLSLLDVGCGEGWLLDAFYKRGYAVQGFDYSNAGISRWHPHLLSFFSQGDIYSLLEDECVLGKRYDVIFLGNVIEHVIAPDALLQTFKKLLSPDGILIVVAPNDFSDLQKYLLDRGAADQPWWLSYPEHLSYFNQDSMKAFLDEAGFELKRITGDFPIELSLLTDLTNYVRDPSVGPQTHKLRMRIDNYIFKQDKNKLLDIYSILGSMGVGRNLIYFSSPRVEGE